MAHPTLLADGHDFPGLSRSGLFCCHRTRVSSTNCYGFVTQNVTRQTEYALWNDPGEARTPQPRLRAVRSTRTAFCGSDRRLASFCAGASKCSPPAPLLESNVIVQTDGT